jgi:hypothetical protein
VVSGGGFEGLHLCTPSPCDQLVLGVILLVQVECWRLWVLDILLWPMFDGV